MRLFEIYTGEKGESYERCYCWAADQFDAILLFQEKYQHKKMREIVECFSLEAGEFITELSDSGWPQKDNLARPVFDVEGLYELLAILAIFAKLADEPCESDESYREFVRKKSQIACNKRNRE